MAKYLANSGGLKIEVQPITTSAGAGDASKIPQTDSAGKLDISLMPTGVGAEVVVAASSENLTAGNWVNLYNNAGTINVRKADATTNAKPAHGFVLANVTSPANATVYLISGQNSATSGKTVGAKQWLDTTAGASTETAPSASGNIVQLLGVATSATNVIFTGWDYYELV